MNDIHWLTRRIVENVAFGEVETLPKYTTLRSFLMRHNDISAQVSSELLNDVQNRPPKFWFSLWSS